ncbi:MAG: TauD/TfdA family dioxygenase [Actinomycetota bacterium]
MGNPALDIDAVEIEPLEGVTFGATVRGVRLTELDDTTFDQLYQAWLEHCLLIFPGQFLSRDEQNQFALRFGQLEFPATAISNVDRQGRVHADPDDDLVKSLRGNEGWHMDSTYMPVQAKGAVFSADVVPSSGAATGWADMRTGYDVLDDDTKQQIADLEAHHSLYYSQGRAGYLPTRNADGGYDLYGYHDQEVSRRPLVKVHPETDRSILVVGRHAHDIPGWSREESQEFLDRLTDEAASGSRIYHHDWEPGDVVIWDNRALMHRGTPFDMTEPRVMWHTRIAGDPVSEAASNHR